MSFCMKWFLCPVEIFHVKLLTHVKKFSSVGQTVSHSVTIYIFGSVICELSEYLYVGIANFSLSTTKK